jgi:hypothetical protein
MRPCIAALLCALTLAAPARADDISGGQFHLGVGADIFTLVRAPAGLQGATQGMDVSAHFDVEVQRALIGTFFSAGANDEVSRAALGFTGGYFLTEGTVGVYAAGGLGVYGISHDFFGKDSAGGLAGIAEVGLRLPRSSQIGRAALALTSWLPAFTYKGSWSPSVQLGLRLEL